MIVAAVGAAVIAGEKTSLVKPDANQTETERD
jgi:hypothetical protein